MNPVGRPSEYNSEYADKVMEYINTTGHTAMELPTVEGFAIYLGFVKRTLYTWAEKYPEFLHALEIISAYQAKQLINDGIYGGKEVNATIVKLLLQNNHGMKERTDVTSNDKEVEIPILPVNDVLSDNSNTKASETE